MREEAKSPCVEQRSASRLAAPNVSCACAKNVEGDVNIGTAPRSVLFTLPLCFGPAREQKAGRGGVGGGDDAECGGHTLLSQHENAKKMQAQILVRKALCGTGENDYTVKLPIVNSGFAIFQPPSPLKIHQQ